MDHSQQNNASSPAAEAKADAIAADQAGSADRGEVWLPQAKEIFRRLGPVGPLAIIAATLPAISGFVLLGVMKWVAPWLRTHDGTGVAIYTAGYALAAGFAILPTYAQSIMGGFAFGRVVGSLAALGGVFGASMIGYVVARRASGDRVNALIDEQPKWKAVRDALIGGSFVRVLGIITLIRIPSNSPFAITNLVLGSTRVNPIAYALGTVIGIAPRTIAVAVVGAGLSDWDPSAGSRRLFIIGIIVTIVVFAIIGAIANKALHKVTQKEG